MVVDGQLVDMEEDEPSSDVDVVVVQESNGGAKSPKVHEEDKN